MNIWDIFIEKNNEIEIKNKKTPDILIRMNP